MGVNISQQLMLFLRSVLLGGVLGLLYDLLRPFRRRGGVVWGGILDALYGITAVSGLFLFVMAGDGELRIFILMGVVGGAVLFFCLLSGSFTDAGELAKKIFGDLPEKFQKTLFFLEEVVYNNIHTTEGPRGLARQKRRR